MIETFNEYVFREKLDYALYEYMLDNMFDKEFQLDEGIKDYLKDVSSKVLTSLKNIFGPLKNDILKIASEMKLDLSSVIEAFKQRDVFKFLKAIGFNLKKVLKAINQLTGVIRQGLFRVFQEMHKMGIFQQLNRGAMKIDELLERYPILKKLTGIAVAGLLIYIWLNMTFIGDLDFDFNFGDVVAAFAGKFSLAQLFTSPSGLMLMTLFATGSVISVPWLGASSLNLLLAVFYTGLVKMKEKNFPVLNLLKKKIRTG